MADIELNNTSEFFFNLSKKELDYLIKELQMLQAEIELNIADCLLSSLPLEDIDLIFRVTK